MAENVRLSERGLRVLRFLMTEPRVQRSGAEIARATGVGSGTLYPFLARIEGAGWVNGEWEEVDPHQAGRPRRRLYRLTGLGQQKANEALAHLQFGTGAAVWAS